MRKFALIGYCVVAVLINPAIGFAQPTMVDAVSASGDTLIQWQDTFPNIRGFIIYRSDTAGGTYEPIAKTAATYYRDPTGTINQPYFYKIRTKYKDGSISSFSDEVTGTAQPFAPDIYEPDNSYLSPSYITKNGLPQSHNFDTLLDEEWLSFTLASGEVVQIRTDKAGIDTDTMIALYDHTGLKRLAYNDDYGAPNFVSRMIYQATTSDTFLLRIKDQFGFFGRGTNYEVAVSSNASDIEPPVIVSLKPATDQNIGTTTILDATVTDNVSVKKATFQSKRASDTNWSTIDTVTATTDAQTRFTKTWTNAYANDDQVQVRVLATDKSNNESPVPLVNSYLVDKLAPQGPINVTKTVDGDQTILSWETEPLSSNDVAGFNIYQSASKDTGFILIGSTSEHEYDDRQPSSAIYYYRVTAVDGIGNESSPVLLSTLVASLDVDLICPGDLATISRTTQIIATTESAYTRIYFKYSLDDAIWTSIPDSFISDDRATFDATLLPQNTLVGMKACIEDLGANSACSKPERHFFVDNQAPVAPASLSSESGPSSILISWPESATADLEEYRVYRRTSAAQNFALVGQTKNTTYFDTSATDSGAVYEYTVTAVDNVGNESPYSNISSSSPGGFGADSFENDDTSSNAALQSVDSISAHTFSGSSDVDWVKFNVNASPRTFKIETLGTADAIAALYSTDEAIVLAQDLRGGSTPVSIDHNFTETGTYYLKIEHYSGGTGVYGLGIWEINGPEAFSIAELQPATGSYTYGEALLTSSLETEYPVQDVTFSYSTDRVNWTEVPGSIYDGFTGAARVSWDTPSLPDGIYSVRLEAEDVFGNTSQSVIGAYHVKNMLPPAPELVPISQVGENALLVSWSPATSDVSGYEVYRSTNPTAAIDPEAAAWSALTTTSSTDIIDDTVTNDVRYFYRVRAIDISGQFTGFSDAQSYVPTDNRTPQITNFTPTSYSVISSDVTLEVTADESLISAVFEYSPDDGLTWLPIGQAIPISPTKWTAYWDISPLYNGVYDVRALVFDQSGNSNAGQPVQTYSVQKNKIIEAHFAESPAFSPNSDGNLEVTTINYTLTAPATVDVVILGASSDVVRTLKTRSSDTPGSYAFKWDGRSDSGMLVGTGRYFYHLTVETFIASEEAEGVINLQLAPVTLTSSLGSGDEVILSANIPGFYPVAETKLNYRQPGETSWQAIGSDLFGADGWELAWKTGSLENGTYDVQAVSRFCGTKGYCYDEYSNFLSIEINNTDLFEPDSELSLASTIDPVSVGSSLWLPEDFPSQERLISPSGDTDLVKFLASADMTYQLRTDSSIDISMALFDPAGNLVASNDEHRNRLNSSITFKAPSTGEYFVELRSTVPSGRGMYRLSLLKLGDQALSGRVVEPNGEGIGGKRVVACDLSLNEIEETYTQNDGSYQIKGLAPGSYKIKIDSKWYPGVALDKPWVATVFEVSSSDITIPDYAFSCGAVCYSNIYGWVRDRSGLAIASAEIDLYYWNLTYTQRTFTDNAGNFYLGGISGNDYLLNITGPEVINSYFSEKDTIQAADVVTVIPGAAQYANSVVDRAATISGKLYDPYTYPAKDVRIFAYRNNEQTYSYSTTSDKAGYYELRGLTPGSYKLFFDTSLASGEIVSQYYSRAWVLASADPVSVSASKNTTVDTGLGDLIPPLTGASIAPATADGTNSWYRSLAPVITLTSSEQSTSYYRWDSSASFDTYSGSLIAPVGIHTLEYYSVDRLLNTEAVRRLELKYDPVAPTGTTLNSTTHQIGQPTSTDSIGMTLSGAIDNESGIFGYSVSYSLNAPATPDTVKDYDADLSAWSSSALASGTWYVNIRAVDNAGNWSPTTSTGPFIVDKVSPDTTIASGPSGLLETASATFTWVASDGATSTADILFSYKLVGRDTDWSSFSPARSASFDQLAEGSYDLYVRAKDQAGNVELVPAIRSFNVDLAVSTHFEETDPAISYSPSCWNTYVIGGLSGGSSKRSNTIGCSATLPFYGRYVELVSIYCPSCGSAKMYMDGVYQQTQFLYASSTQTQRVVLNWSAAQNGQHTIRIEVNNQKHIRSSGYYVVIDAFNVTD